MLFYLDNWMSAGSEREDAERAADAAGADPLRPLRPQQPLRPLPPAPPAAPQRTAARPERKLRPRADGAAHARRRRRLHAEGRHRGGARVHRLDDPQSASARRLPVRAADSRRSARRSSSATRFAAAASRTASRCSTFSPRIRRRPGSSRRSWRGGSSATRRPRRWSIAWRRDSLPRHGDLREVMRTLLTSPEFLAPASFSAKTKTPFEFVVSAVRADRRAARRRASARAVAAGARHAALPVPAADRLQGHRRRVGQHRSAVARMNFAQTLASASPFGVRRAIVRSSATSDERERPNDERQSRSPCRADGV